MKEKRLGNVNISKKDLRKLLQIPEKVDFEINKMPNKVDSYLMNLEGDGLPIMAEGSEIITLGYSIEETFCNNRKFTRLTISHFEKEQDSLFFVTADCNKKPMAQFKDFFSALDFVLNNYDQNAGVEIKNTESYCFYVHNTDSFSPEVNFSLENINCPFCGDKKRKKRRNSDKKIEGTMGSALVFSLRCCKCLKDFHLAHSF